MPSPMEHSLPPRLRAALWVLASTLAFSVVFASGKLLGGAVPSLQIVLIRYVSGFVVVAGLAAAATPGLRLILATDRRLLHLLRAFCGAAGGGATIYAATHMPLADAASLGLTQGVFVVLLALFFLRERVAPGQWLATVLCLAGALIIIRGNASDVPVPAGPIEFGLAPALALVGALLIAGEVVLIKVLVAREGAMTMLLYVNGFAALLLALPAALIWHPIEVGQLAALCLLGPLAISGQFFNVRAYRIADAAFLAPFGYSALVFAGVIGWVFFGEAPTAASYLGAALIVAGGVLLVRAR
jgi:drug/metabolite transporter (DMT)-like permease